MSFHPIMPYKEGFQKSDRVLLQKGEPFAYTPERAAKLEDICSKYPPEWRKSAVLAALYLVQDQQGYLTATALRHVAQFLRITPAEVEDVATYYVMFYKAPVGKYVLQVCRTLSCAIRGGPALLAQCEKRLGVSVGGTKGDFTLEHAECLASCGTAPVLTVNDEFHENLTPEKVDAILDRIGAPK